MWTRKQLKENAKNVLSKYYWTAFAVSFVIGLVAGSGGGASFSSFSRITDTIAEEINSSGASPEDIAETILDNPEILTILVVTLGVMFFISAIVWAIGTALNIFLFNPLRAGKYAYYIRQREDCGKFGNLTLAFKKGKYKGTIKTLFLKDLYLWLWSLLFIIPGIIKSYSYFMVPYIVADQPELESSRVFEISKQTMKGNKWKLFVLQLSFILWELACVCTCGIGFLFLAPYKEATYAELYACLKTKAMRDGIITEGELPRSLWSDSSPASSFE